MILFLVLFVGYAIGRIKIYGLSLGTSAVLISALVFGHFGFELPSFVKNLGLICFVTSIGFIAGPDFFSNFKQKAIQNVALGLIIVVSAAIICGLVILITGYPKGLCVGIFTGALTSTPGLAAAIEATNDAMASVGYGIAYPFGVVGVVLCVQLAPRLLKAGKYEPPHSSEEKLNKVRKGQNLIRVDKYGLFPLSFAIILGLMIAKINVPLPGGASFNLGTTGGPLIVGLILGNYGRIGKISLEVNKNTANVLREFGLALFLSGAGIDAGKGFVDTLSQYGISLFFVGVLITLIPTFIGMVIAMKAFKFDVYMALSCVCGGQTSTPALGALIDVCESDSIAVGYASTYPAALIAVVLCSQFLSIIF